MRLREVVSECAKNRGKSEDKHPPRPGRAPSKDDACDGHAGRDAKRDGRQRDVRREPDADEPSQCEQDERRCHAVILSPFKREEKGGVRWNEVKLVITPHANLPGIRVLDNHLFSRYDND